ncbi:ROK family protein [Arundinibacter roseus]|uniref:ROK family protein n=1 Tax=Arundinibacter roseus TaxID=2070510 RepID=A0A4R4K5N4_9BACT|nr:ROK family protein [Arundinibacter roseus]TDB61781.1 ROK family protein [Arundinibacter roseus]
MIIGVDIGGTNLRAGIEMNGAIVQKAEVLLRDKDSLDATLAQLIHLIRPLAEGYPIEGIGVGVPSVVDVRQGIVYNAINIPSWERVELKAILEKEFNVPVFVNNDVNCFTLGEHRYGLARSYSSVVGMTIGTGLGSGIIINNQLYTGSNCGAGEIGMLPYLDRTLEFYACSSFFESIHGISAYEAGQLAAQGDRRGMRIWAEFGVHLGFVIKAVLYAYDPEIIILGGSISKGYAYFHKALFESLDDFAFPESIKKLKFLPSLDENIALLGAAALVQPQACRV